MFAHFNVALTKQDYVGGLAVLTRELGRRDPSRDKRIWEQIGAGTLLFLVLLWLFRDAAMAVFVTLLAESFLLAALGGRWVRKSFGVSYDPATAHFAGRFGDDGIDEQIAGRTRHWDWAAVRAVHDSGKELVLEFDGWDMLILPYRLWNDDLARAAFLREVRQRIPTRTDAIVNEPRHIGPLQRDQLAIGAIAAAVDTMFLVTFLVPSTGRTDLPIVLTAFALGLAAAYFAYRLARFALPELYMQSPRAALTASHLLTWAVPTYMLAAFLGWI